MRGAAEIDPLAREEARERRDEGEFGELRRLETKRTGPEPAPRAVLLDPEEEDGCQDEERGTIGDPGGVLPDPQGDEEADGEGAQPEGQSHEVPPEVAVAGALGLVRRTVDRERADGQKEHDRQHRGPVPVLPVDARDPHRQSPSPQAASSQGASIETSSGNEPVRKTCSTRCATGAAIEPP